MFRPHTILCPIDFSPTSGQAYTLACALAQDYAARLVALHVAPPPVRGKALAELHRYESAWEAFCQAHAPSPAVQVERCYKPGDPAARILGMAQDITADLIVMGAHGRSGRGRDPLGRVATQVSRQARCPVFTVKEPESGATAYPESRLEESLSP